MEKIIRLTESDLTRIVKLIISESEDSNVSKPKTLKDFLKICSSGTFRTFTDGTHLYCEKNGKEIVFISDKNPYTPGGIKRTGVVGSWNSEGDVVYLRSTLYGKKTLK